MHPQSFLIRHHCLVFDSVRPCYQFVWLGKVHKKPDPALLVLTDKVLWCKSGCYKHVDEIHSRVCVCVCVCMTGCDFECRQEARGEETAGIHQD